MQELGLGKDVVMVSIGARNNKMAITISQSCYDLTKKERGVSTNPFEDPTAAYLMKDLLAGVKLGLIIVPDDLKW